MAEREQIFVPTSEIVKAFVKENPHADPRTSLHFLRELYPPVVNGETIWMPEGSFARMVHRPNVARRKPPKDLDIVSRDEAMVKALGGVIELGDVKADWQGPIDARGSRYWFKARRYNFSKKLEDQLFEAYVEHVIDGITYRFMREDFVMMSKIQTFDGKGPREPDIEDVLSYGRPIEDAKRVFYSLGGVKGGFKVPPELASI